MSSIKDIIRNRFRNYVVVILLMAVIALVSIVVLILDCPDWVDVLANSTLGAVIGASLVDLACSVAAGKEADEDMRRGIMETLCPSKSYSGKPELYSIYKKEAIEPILQQCLSAYCADNRLSAGFLSYIKSSCRHMKRNEKYIVEVKRDSKGDAYINQSLRHTAMFNLKQGETAYFQAYFIFEDKASVAIKKGLLDEVMNDKSYFFRESLLDDTFAEELINDFKIAEPKGKMAVNAAVLKKLSFSLDVFSDEYDKTSCIGISASDFDVTLDSMKDKNGNTVYYGLKIKTNIPLSCVKKCDQFFEEEGFVQFTARMNTEYRIPQTQNTFYVVYAIPSLNPFFEIKFNMGTSTFAKTVDYMTFMSIDNSMNPDNPDDGKVLEHGSALSFRTKSIVFPRSGMAFTWNS